MSSLSLQTKLFDLTQQLNVSQELPLFSYPGPHNSIQCLTYSKFNRALSALLDACDLEASKYSDNSFRRGGASFAAACGIPPHLIKLQGDWKSDAYLRYIDTPVHLRAQLFQVLASHL